MKTYRFKFEDVNSFSKQLKQVKTECEQLRSCDVTFYLTWIYDFRDKVQQVTDCIEEFFPKAIYYGNESAGNIYDGEITYGVTVTCYVFEDETTKTKLVFVKEGTKYGCLEDLWKLCRSEKGLRAVEMIPSLTYLEVLKIDNSIPDLGDDVLIFGGASDDYYNNDFEADILAKGHKMTRRGMAVVLYYGENLNMSYDYVLGWKGLGRYMKVTKSHDKVIEEIDGQPPHNIYEKYLGITDDNMANLVFPLIVEENGIEYIRTPQSVLPDNSMSMFANIEEGLTARIAYGDKNTILNSLLEKAPDIAAFRPQALKAYSCAARRLFWGDDEVYKETLPLNDIAPISGFYTGGELLRFGKKLRVLNCTLVVIGFREGDASDIEKTNVVRFEQNDKSLISRITHFVEVVTEEQKEALRVANEEKLRNDLIHDIIHSGKWSFAVSADDKVTGFEFSDEVRRIVNNDFTEQNKDWTSILHPDDKPAVMKAFYATIADHSCNTPYDVTYRMADKNGEYHWFHSAGRIVRDETGAGEMFGIHIDISDQIETQLKQKQELQNALLMADSANRAKTEFLFNMSHDIRTPMNAVLGFTNMAIRHVDDTEKTIDCLHKIQKSGDLLLSLINSVLEVSRIESGKAVLDEQCGDIYQCFTNVESTMKAMADIKDIELKFEFGDILDRYVYYDFSRCSRIFVNIISNAVKYTNESGHVTVKCEQIKPVRKGRAVYRFTFSDDGFGMSEEFQKHVFEQFSREQTTTVTGIQGSGLGMAVCKSFVDLMGGRITCKSKVGEGTVFKVELPFRVQKEDDCANPHTREESGRQDEMSQYVIHDFHDKRVLIVEDNELNREIAISILEDEGLRVDSAEDGDVAVERLREMGPEYYDYILMDIQMPVMNGYEATKAIREMYPEVHIPIIALSANAFAEDRNASYNAGMDDHIAKPINIRELMNCLSRHVKHDK